MQNLVELTGFTRIRRVAPIDVETHGGRAKAMQRLVRLDLPVPPTAALSFEAVHRITTGHMPDLAALIDTFGDGALLSVRPSSQAPDWGGPLAMLNIGMNSERHAAMVSSHGAVAADQVYLRFVQTFALNVARLDPEMFVSDSSDDAQALEEALASYANETEAEFPQDPIEQLGDVLRLMARAWEGTSARLLRQARGAPADAGLGLVVQKMALGVGPGESGQGVIRFVDRDSGDTVIRGRYIRQSQGHPPAVPADKPNGLLGDNSLEEDCPEIFAALQEMGAVCRLKLREEMQLEFIVEDGALSILDAIRVQRSNRATIRVATDLANDDIISRQEAVLRVEPHSLSELLHPRVDPRGERDTILTGIAASPGAAVGRVVFSATEAQASAARGEPCVLVTREPAPKISAECTHPLPC